MENLSMLTEQVSVSDLKEDARNARKHGARNVAAIEASVRQFGFVTPIVVNQKDRVVLGGNARLQVAKKLGIKTVPVVWVNLNRKEASALALALNRTAELADWDIETLVDLIDEISESPEADALLGATGFAPLELKSLSSNLDAMLEGIKDDDEDRTKPDDEQSDCDSSFTVKVALNAEVDRDSVAELIQRAVSKRWPEGKVTVK